MRVDAAERVYIFYAWSTRKTAFIKGKKIKKASVTYIFTTNEIAKEKYDDLLEEAKNNNWSTSFKLEGNKITNISNKDEIIELAISNNENKDNKSKNAVVDGLKAQGYTCK